jgi:hypothetical protein
MRQYANANKQNAVDFLMPRTLFLHFDNMHKQRNKNKCLKWLSDWTRESGRFRAFCAHVISPSLSLCLCPAPEPNPAGNIKHEERGIDEIKSLFPISFSFPAMSAPKRKRGEEVYVCRRHTLGLFTTPFM